MAFRKSLALIPVLFIALFLVGGCSLKKMIKAAKDQQLTVKPNPLELHGDSVAFEMSAILPTKMLKKNKIYTLQTWYSYGDQQKDLPEISFKAEDYPDQKTENPKVTQNFSFYYVDDMRRGDLMIKGVASNLNGKQLSTPEMSIAKGVITTSRMVDYIYETAYVDHGYNNKEELIPTYVDFYFPQGSSRLLYKERTGEQANFLKGFLADENVTRTVVFTGSHSPEGAEAVNVELAGDRAETVKAFYQKMMGKYDEDQIDSVEFVTKSIVRNWDIVLDTLEKANSLSDDQKKQVRDIINKNKGSKTFEQVEDMLHDLPFYDNMLKNMYPKLRTVQTEVLTVKPKKTDAQISMLSKKITMDSVPADTLSDEELAYAATLTPDLDEKESIYKAAIKKNDAYSSHNNLAAVYLQKASTKTGDAKAKLIEQARSHLDIAKAQNATAEVYNNMAVAALMEGKIDEADKHIAQAKTMAKDQMLTKKINSNMGPIKIRKAVYDQALTALGNGVQENALVAYNKGLANLLQDNADQAITNLNDSKSLDDKNANTYYLLAVAYSRKDDKGNMTKNLKKAVSMNSDLRKRALNDLEFMDYFEDQVFKDALR